MTICLRAHKHGEPLKALRSGRLDELRAQTTASIHLDEPVLSPPNSFSRSSQCVWKIRSSDLSKPETQEAVRRQSDTNGPVIRAMVEKEVGHLVWGGGLYMRDQAMAAPNRANDILSCYMILLGRGAVSTRGRKRCTLESLSTERILLRVAADPNG